MMTIPSPQFRWLPGVAFKAGYTISPIGDDHVRSGPLPIQVRDILVIQSHIAYFKDPMFTHKISQICLFTRYLYSPNTSLHC